MRERRKTKKRSRRPRRRLWWLAFWLALVVLAAGAAIFVAFSGWLNPVSLEQRPPVTAQAFPGQLTVDPESASWMSIAGVATARESRGFYMAAPGDPKDFFYRGRRNADGTRIGDQAKIIERLASTGANGLYLQVIRSHGGDGDTTHNPFINNDPASGLNDAVMRRWRAWLVTMNEGGVVPYVFVYGNNATVWETGDEVAAQEAVFLQGLVAAFTDVKNLVWVIAEEYQEAFTVARVSNIARVLAQADPNRRVIGVHKSSGTNFAEFANDPFIDQFLMKLNSLDDQAIYQKLSAAHQLAGGRYSINLAAESADWGSGLQMQRKAWATALGGAYLMVPGLVPGAQTDAVNNADLLTLGRLARFMASVRHSHMRPLPQLRSRNTTWLLASPGSDFIAYAKAGAQQIGVLGLAPGEFELSWFDPQSGARSAGTHHQTRVGEGVFERATGWQRQDAVLYARRKPAAPAMSFPDPTWQRIPRAHSDFDQDKLNAASLQWGGSGCITHYGRLAYCWGDVANTSFEWGSVAKPVLSTLLMIAVQENLIGNTSAPVRALGWPLWGKDAGITFAQLPNMTSGYARDERPGQAWAYNDVAIRLYALSLQRLFGMSLNDVAKSRLATLDFTGPAIFRSHQGLRLKMSVLDMARIGLLWLNGGRWKGQSILAPALFSQMNQPQVAATLPVTRRAWYDYLSIGSYGGSSDQTAYGPGVYGSNWWFNLTNDTSPEFLLPALPADTYQARGHAGKELATMIPSMGLVIVTHGQDIEKAPYEASNAKSAVQINRMLAQFISARRAPR